LKPRYRHALMLSTLLLSRGLAAQPAMPGVPDVRAEVMQMLEQARLRGETTGLTPAEEAEFQRAVDGVVETTPKPRAEPDLFDRLQGEVKSEKTVDTAPERKIESSSKRQTATPAKTVARPEVQPEPPHLLLPQKEITIRDLSDLKKLSREFQEAQPREGQP
jgi:hypothetical protein